MKTTLWNSKTMVNIRCSVKLIRYKLTHLFKKKNKRVMVKLKPMDYDKIMELGNKIKANMEGNLNFPMPAAALKEFKDAINEYTSVENKTPLASAGFISVMSYRVKAVMRMFF